MRKRWTVGLVASVMLASSLALAQQTCANGMRVEGTITDPTGAVIPGARVLAGTGEKTTTTTTGQYVLRCVPRASSTIMVEADGFATATVRARAFGRNGSCRSTACYCVSTG